MTKCSVGDKIITKKEVSIPDTPNISIGVMGIIKEVKESKNSVEYLIDFEFKANGSDYNSITLFESEDLITLVI